MKKGFTLIELLAVIVILAIIALIATPIIMGIIEESKKNSAIESVRLYVDGLAKKIASNNAIEEFNPATCTVGETLTCDGETVEYDLNGKKPTSGTINFSNGKVISYTIHINGYIVIKDENGVRATKEGNTPVETHTTYALGQLIQYDPVNNSTCTSGYTCYKWRVITVNDTASNSTITLQMDHNIINTAAWVNQEDYDNNTNWNSHKKNDKGPITALEMLEEETTLWDDSLKLNYSYDTSGGHYSYGTLSCTNGTCTIGGDTVTTDLKARMITGEEVAAIVMATGAEEGTYADGWSLNFGDSFAFSNLYYELGSQNDGTGNTDLAWLIENTSEDTYYDSGSTDNIYDSSNWGYWTLSPSPWYEPERAWCVLVGGFLGDNNVSYSSYYGIRPVITISKNVLD